MPDLGGLQFFCTAQRPNRDPVNRHNLHENTDLNDKRAPINSQVTGVIYPLIESCGFQSGLKNRQVTRPIRQFYLRQSR